MKMKPFFWLAIAFFTGQATANDGQFLQYDQASSGNTLVAVQSIGDLQIGGAFSQWSDTGKSWGINLTQRVHSLTLADTTLQLRAGLTALQHEDDTGHTAALGVKLAAEHYSDKPWGRTYALVEVSSAFKSWLGVLQYTPPNSSLGLEWSAVGDGRWFVGHRLALRYAIEGTAWSARAGRQLESGNAIFLGISYNSY